jgi:glycerol-3-phosphate acyltransferase PlsY
LPIDFMLINYLVIIIAYLFGSLAGAIVVCYFLRLPDPRTQGSGNPGATNVLRQNGKLAAALTLLIDVFKGISAVAIAHWLTSTAAILAGATLAVFLGHLYPIFFGFRGGKGVATAGGALLILDWQAGLAILGTWLLMALLFRYASLAAVVSALLAPIYMFWFTGIWEYVAVTIIMSGLLIWRHRSNLHNLWIGAEDKIGEA